MIKKSQIGLVKSIYKPLNKYFAGWGYRRNGKYYVRMGGGYMEYIDFVLDEGFEKITITKIKDLDMTFEDKPTFENWEEPYKIESAAEYLKETIQAG